MIAPNRSMHDAFNQELNRELQYNVDTLQEFVRNNVPLLNEQQKQVYETLMQAVDNNTGGLFFLDAPGGTGKTFVISLILATIRSRCDIALALASSGIAATLLDGGRTAHSALKLPLNLNTIDTPTCNISRSSAMGKLLMQCKLIVWDECTMAHKKSLEALNFTLKDLRRNNNIFGGLMILLAGDFRQTLPVVPRGTPADELNACLKASPLWNNVKTLSLTTNMRVQLQNDQSAAQFSKQLLDLGNGKVPVDATSGLITLTNDFCRFVDTQLVLIENVFPNISENYKNYAWLSQQAILAAKNNDVHALNFTIQSKIAGDLVTYKSVDSITNPDDVVNYPTEFLNSLEIPGFPPHNLQLKVGTVIMILRNLNPPRLCNGTRLSVKRLMPNLIEATIINGKYAAISENEKLLPLSPNYKVLNPKKCYEHHATSDVKELIFSSPIMTTPKRRIQDIIDIPSPNLKINSCDDDTPKKKKLKSQFQSQSNKMKSKRWRISKLKKSLQMFKVRNTVSKVIDTFPFPSINSKALVTMQIRKNRLPWSPQEKQLSLFLFYKSPAAYNFLKLQNVNLPGTSTIRRWIVCFDEISIKECLEFSKHYDFIKGFENFGHLGRSSNVANTSLVFMARGIFSPWKIPIAYYLVRSAVKHGMLKDLIVYVLRTLLEAGLHPKIIVCDKGTNNQSTLKALNVTEHNPYFFINDKKYMLYLMFCIF
ncbi:hypothetical protein QTP88_011412 [Uroleucon formosanum]